MKMTRIFPLWVLWLAILTTTYADTLRATVLRVVDGDTVRVQLAGRQIAVRLDSIDAPERHQAGGRDAQRVLAGYLPAGSRVKLVSLGEDRYGRTLAQVYRADGLNVNEQMVRDGQAWVFTKYCRNIGYWGPLEEKARRARAGLWAEANPVSPWRFRGHKSPRHHSSTTSERN